MTFKERHDLTRWLDRAIPPLAALIVGTIFMLWAGAVCADTMTETIKVAGIVDRAIEVAAGKSVLWLALASATLSAIADIVLIVVVFKIVVRGIAAIEGLKK